MSTLLLSFLLPKHWLMNVFSIVTWGKQPPWNPPFYCVTHGHVVGVLPSWEHTLNAVLGVPDFKYEEVDTIAIDSSIQSVNETRVSLKDIKRRFQRAQECNVIAALDTGSGKTFISILLIKWIMLQECSQQSHRISGTQGSSGRTTGQLYHPAYSFGSQKFSIAYIIAQ
ncbi:uncharacterized protein F5147DRAFT_788835 [Suillus discolor]|uniref:Uncharacterized protein n=1 Tax=Suillus discolor TaxID=1912936 RepID=A0A9P7FE55_9AGAM|nr:uncharacterized protein F5147DRAFT_788835 [Suillus discolor]KAG2113417.1 hypothetical protein F5147DRAFT_788835 [Suillus discolor]